MNKKMSPVGRRSLDRNDFLNDTISGAQKWSSNPVSQSVPPAFVTSVSRMWVRTPVVKDCGIKESLKDRSDSIFNSLPIVNLSGESSSLVLVCFQCLSSPNKKKVDLNPTVFAEGSFYPEFNKTAFFFLNGIYF